LSLCLLEYIHTINCNCRLDNISQVLNEDSSSNINRCAFLSYFQLMTTAHIVTQMLRLLLVVMIMMMVILMENRRGLQLKIMSANEAWIYIA